MSQTVAVPAADPPPPPGDALLDAVDPSPGTHALLIGHATLDMLCSLIRRGCAGAAELRPDGHAGPGPDSAQLVVLPDPASLAEAAAAIAIARRALIGGGRIVIRDAGGRWGRRLAALLRMQGFVAICTRHTPDGTLVLGERPAPQMRA